MIILHKRVVTLYCVKLINNNNDYYNNNNNKSPQFFFTAVAEKTCSGPGTQKLSVISGISHLLT